MAVSVIRLFTVFDQLSADTLEKSGIARQARQDVVKRFCSVNMAKAIPVFYRIK